MKTLALALIVFTAASVSAQTPAADPSGHWKGTIEVPGNPTAFEADIATNARGELVGTATAGPDRVSVPLQKIALEGRQLTFYVRADQPMRGDLSAGGTSVSGTATLSGYELPFTMSRSGDAKIDPPPTSPAVSKPLEGEWKGVVSTASAQYHFVVTIANRADGRATAQLVSVDEGGMTLPLVVAQDGSNVKLASRGVPLSYAGTLNAAGTEISGIFTEGATSLPLTLTR